MLSLGEAVLLISSLLTEPLRFAAQGLMFLGSRAILGAAQQLAGEANACLLSQSR